MCFEKADEKMRQELATKADLFETKSELKADLFAVKSELKAEIEKLRLEMALSKNDTIKWVAGMLVAQAAAIAALVKLL